MAPHGAVRPSVRPGPAVAVGRPCPPTWIGSSETVAPTGASMRCSSVIASTAFSSDPARPWHQADVDGGDAGAERLLSSLKSVHRTLDEAVRRTESRLEYPSRLGRTGREPGRIEAQARSCSNITPTSGAARGRRLPDGTRWSSRIGWRCRAIASCGRSSVQPRCATGRATCRRLAGRSSGASAGTSSPRPGRARQ